MKTPRLLTLFIAATVFVAASLHLSAAEVAVDVSSFAPRDPDAVIQQIELNVLLKQYEKLLTQIGESRLEYELARLESNGTDKQKKEMDDRMQGKMMTLQKLLLNCRAQIQEIVGDARAKAEALEKEKAAEKAKQKAAQSRPAARNPV
jgi:predicted RNase H-like nuclease